MGFFSLELAADSQILSKVSWAASNASRKRSQGERNQWLPDSSLHSSFPSLHLLDTPSWKNKTKKSLFPNFFFFFFKMMDFM